MDEEKTLEQELIDELTPVLSEIDDVFSAVLLQAKVKAAIREIRKARKYPSSYTEDMINSDLYDFYQNIYDLAYYDYVKLGNEGQISGTENGVTKSYESREKCFNGVIPLARI